MRKTLLNLKLAFTLLSLLMITAFGSQVLAQDAGTMPTAFSPACSGTFINTSTLGEDVPPGFGLTYVIHNGTSALGTIYGSNPNGLFTNDGSIPTNIDLAISAVVAPLVGGAPDLNNIADAALPGTPVRMYDPIVIDYSFTCDPVTGTLNVNFNVTGGAPAYPDNNNFVYTIAGDYNGIINTPGQNFSFSLNSVNGFSIEVVDDGKNCSALVTETVPCYPCANDAGNPQGPQQVCSGDQATGTASGINADPGSAVVYYLHSGPTYTGTAIDSNGTGVFFNNGTYPIGTQLYISSVVGPGAPDLNNPCTDVMASGTPVTFLAPITATSSSTCDEVSGTTTVTFTASGGSGSYTVSGDYTGTATSGAPVTFMIPEGSGSYTLNFTDAAGCSGSTTQNYNCEGCDNEAGNPGPAQIICAGGSANGTTTGSVVDPGSSLVYVLHTGSNAVGQILSTNSTGTFSNSGFPVNTQLYISAAVGVLGADGLPDLNDPCSDISLPGTPVVFLTPITMSSNTVCDVVTGTTTVTLTAGGGLPMFNGSSYTLTGSYTGSSTAGQAVVFTIPEGSGTYTVSAVDGNGCSASETGNYNCEGCDNFAGTPQAPQTVCAGDVGFGAVSDAIVDPGSTLEYVLHSGNISSPIAVNSTGSFSNTGTYPVNTQLYVSSVVGPQGANSNLADPCVDFQAQGTPVVFLTPITISLNTSCDVVTGVTSVTVVVGGGLSMYDGSAYTITGDYTGSSTAGSTINFTVPEGSGVLTINVADGAGCSNFDDIPFNCEGCDNNAGAPAAPQQVCTGDVAFGGSTGSIVDAGSTLEYVLHSGNISNPLAVNTTGNFTNNGTYPTNTQLYISAVVGPQGANSNLADPCVDFQDPGTPVTFLTPIVITENLSCDEVSGTTTVVFNVSGGTGNYTISGSYSGSTSAGQSVTFTIAEGSGTYSINATDAAGCSALASGNYNCDGCDNEAGVQPPGPIDVCAGQSGSAPTSGQIVDPGSTLVYALHDGTAATIYDTNSTGTFTNTGSYPVGVQLYISALVGELGGNGLPNLADPCSDANLPGTPVTFWGAISISDSFTCDEVSGNITVTYSVTGGTGSYTVTGNDPGSTTAGTTNTFVIPEGTGTYTISVVDGAGCTASIAQPYACDGCDNEAGVQPPGPITVCAGGSASAPTSGQIVDPGSALVYALHDGTGATIYDTNNSGTFTNTGSYPNGVQLYISALVGELGANGLPNFADPCTDANLPGTPVTFYGPISINDSFVCDMVSGDVTVSFTVSGGSGSYSISGSYTGTATAGQNVTFVIPEGSFSYTISVSDGANCVATETQPYNCMGCSNDAGTMPQFPQELCSGESVSTISSGFNIQTGAGLVYALHTGSNSVGTIIDINTTGTFVNNGQYPINTQLYVSAVVAEINNGVPNLNDPCLDVALPGTPVTMYAPLTINGSGSCDMITGVYTVTISVSGGKPGSYNVTGDYNGTVSTGTLTFADNGDGLVSIFATDGAGCTASYTDTYVCMGCLGNDAGVLPSTLTTACFGGTLSVNAVGAVVGTGAIASYFLQDVNGNILDVNSTGTFTNDGSQNHPVNTELYVCCAVGPDNGNGIVDLNHPCTDVTDVCAPVGFLAPIVIDHDYICDNSVGEYTVSFNISGGGPSFPGSTHVYNVSGNYNGQVPAGPTFTFGPLGDGATYSIIVSSDGKGCSSNFTSDPIQCEKLPIELISYTGEVQPEGNLLKWSTATEENNDYFTMERSNDGGVNFTIIENDIPGAGNSIIPMYYDLFDRDAPAGTSYYRLSQTDYDGTHVIVGIVELTRGEVSLDILDMYPMPVQDVLTVNISSNNNANANLFITDMLGQVVFSQVVDVNHDFNTFEVVVSDFADGVYFLTVENASGAVTEKFLKK